MGVNFIPSVSVDMSLLGGGGYVFVPLIKPLTVVQGTWTNTISTSRFNNYFNNGATHADGDECTFKVMLSQGTYNLQYTGHTGPGMGIVEILLDAVSIASFDCYAGGDSDAGILEETAITISAGKLFTLTFKMNGKNAGASTYGCVCSSLTFVKTA